MKAARSLLDTFPFAPPKTSLGVPADSWKTREEQWERLRPARQRGILNHLRAAFKEGEQSLIGWDAILAWLHQHGFRNREGRPVNVRTVRGWSKRLGCPVWRGCRAFASRTRSSPPWTSNYLLLAWAVSLYRSDGPDMPRIERPGDAKSSARMSRYSARDAGSSSSALGSPTRASTPRPEPGPRPRRFIPPEHGAPPPTRRTVMGPRGDDQGA